MSYDNSSREKTICGKSHFRNTVLVCKDNVLFDEAMKLSLKREGLEMNAKNTLNDHAFFQSHVM